MVVMLMMLVRIEEVVMTAVVVQEILMIMIAMLVMVVVATDGYVAKGSSTSLATFSGIGTSGDDTTVDGTS
jgi:hypothetical protein